MPAAGPFVTVWANQWEPQGSPARQFAARCYEERFGYGSVVNEDIHAVLGAYEVGEIDIPDVDMVVGGFPCQDYSVAKPLSQANGIEGKKGVLWWDIYRFLRLKQPKYCLFENVDRLLKSPASQRGRDFAIILSCLASLGYSAEWRVVNGADYGFPQKRRRVYIYAERTEDAWDLKERLRAGVMADALPARCVATEATIPIYDDPFENTERFGVGLKTSPFQNAGVMQGCTVMTAKVEAAYEGPSKTLGDVLVSDSEVPEEFSSTRRSLPNGAISRVGRTSHASTKRRALRIGILRAPWLFPTPLTRLPEPSLPVKGGGRLLEANILSRRRTAGIAVWSQMSSISFRASREAGRTPA